ncbi:hypothetical protein INT47_009226 [Mucor saturninus]|uniref:Uncharacterized protein n=1 Tax=Mucor saturninus TaxID=64648 RepID=A0A8H7QK12_9FUNG|nr:hypothetical protein INT47_009226 [Mucor saturninus]
MIDIQPALNILIILLRQISLFLFLIRCFISRISHAHNPSPGVYEAFKAILYNDIKIPFTRAKARFNGAVGEDWSPAKSRETIAHASGHWRKGVEIYQRCLEEHQETQFTSRLEVRASAADVDDLLVHKLMDGLHRLQSNGAFVHFFVDEYLGYVRELLVMTTEMMVSLSQRVDLPSVSGFALCVYILNSLMHPCDKGSTCCHDFVKTYRCSKNRLFFMDPYFVFFNNEWNFMRSFDSTRMASMFPGLSFVRTLVVDGDSVLNELDRMADASEVNSDNFDLAIEVALNNTVNYTASFGPLTFAPCVRFLACPVDVEQVSGTWLTNKCHPMFDLTNPKTVAYADKTRQLFHRFGLGPESAVRFLDIFFEEYFSLVGGAHTVCGITNLSFGGEQSAFDPELRDAIDLAIKMDFHKRVAFLLPFVEAEDRNREWVQSLIYDGRIDRAWKAFGSRSVFLELYLHGDITASSLQHFFNVLMAASIYTLEYVPMACPTKLYRRNSPTTIATRKISWFLEPMGEVSREMYHFCRSYAFNHKFEDANFPRQYRRVTEIHASRVSGSVIPRVRAKRQRRNGRLY